MLRGIALVNRASREGVDDWDESGLLGDDAGARHSSLSFADI
jgi:hypothetical protein